MEFERIAQYMDSSIEAKKRLLPWFDVGDNSIEGMLEPLPSIDESLELYRKHIGNKKDDTTISE